MAVSQSQRLRKAAAKAAKRKVVVAEKLARERREWTISKPRHINLAISPIVACTMTEDYQTRGIGTLTVTRKLPLGRYGVCIFLLDMWCLGVKDAFFRVLDSDQYKEFCENIDLSAPVAPIEPAQARKLLRDAAAYGASNGFPPPDSLAELERIFGDVAPADTTFVFGDGGKPHYVPGPNASHARALQICRRLAETLGPEGFTRTFPFDLLDEDELDDFGPDILEGEVVEESASEDRDDSRTEPPAA